MLPTSWGQGVYKTWVWSEDCGFKPNGRTICNLLPKAIKPPTLGQTRLLYLDSHRVRRSRYPILNVIGISNQYKSSCLVIFFDWFTFFFYLGKRYRSLGLLWHVLLLRLPRTRLSQRNKATRFKNHIWYFGTDSASRTLLWLEIKLLEKATTSGENLVIYSPCPATLTFQPCM